MLCASPAHANPAVAVVKEKQTQLFRLIEQPKSPSRDAQIKSIFDTYLNYPRLARDSLGDHWGKLDESQQAEFSSLLEQLITNAYRRNLQNIVDHEMRYTGAEDKGGVQLVKTEAVSKTDQRAEPVELDFLLEKQPNGSWLVVDIRPEGASLVKTYRSQFTRIIDKKGYDELVRLMKKKIAKGS